MSIYIANWKMNLSPKESKALARSFTRLNLKAKDKLIICPDFLSLEAVGKLITKHSKIFLGAQDTGLVNRGPYTGDVSPLDLKNLGVKYVLVGHSERRSHHQESEKLLAQKIKTILSNKMIPILCIGENAIDRKQGKEMSVVKTQLRNALQDLAISSLKRIIIAYEPIWAIGTGLNCDRDQAIRVKLTISEWCRRRGLTKIPVLYGGSVKPDNTSNYLGQDAFDGLLIGSSSLDYKSFKQIIETKKTETKKS